MGGSLLPNLCWTKGKQLEKKSFKGWSADMFNLNNPKLTKQKKEYLLALQTDKDFKEEVEKQTKEDKTFCLEVVIL